MSIERLIAGIANRTDAERKSMRERALAGLKSGHAARMAESSQLLTALDAFEAERASSKLDLISNLATASLRQRVIAAFEAVEPTPTERQLIKALSDHPGSTCAELSAKLGWAPNTWDMGFGALCAQRAVFLTALAGTPREGRSANLSLLTLQDRDDEGTIRYTMKLEAIEAFEQLGY